MILWSPYQGAEPGVEEPTEVLGSDPVERSESGAPSSRRVKAAALALLLALFSPSVLPAELPVSSEKQTPMAAESYFGEIELVSHDGRTLRLYQDLMKNKTVVFSAFFSRCQSVCPPLNAKLQGLQRALGPRVGKDVLFVSITVDPEFDTPARLSEVAAKLHAGPGWLLMSGSPEQVHTALLRLGYATPEKEAHSPLLVVAREKTGVWKKAHGFAPIDDLLQIVRAVMDEAP
jgi:protein SCO1/2